MPGKTAFAPPSLTLRLSSVLRRPCLCGGSMARVHAHCLQAWLKRRRADVSQEDAFKCEVCKAPYRLHIREYFNCTAAALCSWTTCGFCTEFAVIAAALITLAGVFCLSILNDEVTVNLESCLSDVEAWFV